MILIFSKHSLFNVLYQTSGEKINIISRVDLHAWVIYDIHDKMLFWICFRVFEEISSMFILLFCLIFSRSLCHPSPFTFLVPSLYSVSFWSSCIVCGSDLCPWCILLVIVCSCFVGWFPLYRWNCPNSNLGGCGFWLLWWYHEFLGVWPISVIYICSLYWFSHPICNFNSFVFSVWICRCNGESSRSSFNIISTYCYSFLFLQMDFR